MAQQDVNTIINAIHNFAAVRQARNQQALEQQRADDEKQNQQDRLQIERDKLKQEGDYQKSVLKATQALHDVQIQKAQQEIGQQAAQTGIVPYSVQSQPAQSTPGGGMMSPISGVGNQQLLTFPDQTQLTVPTPLAYAQQQADQQRIIQAPAEEIKTREQAAAQEAETKRQLATGQQAHQNKLQELFLEQNYNNQRQQNQLAAEKAMRDSQNATTLQAKMLEVTGGLSGMPNNAIITTGPDGQPTLQPVDKNAYVNNAMDAIRNGRLSSDEFRKQYGKQANTLMQMASSTGLGMLSKDDKAKLDDLETAAKIAPIMKELVQIRTTYPTKDMIPGTDAYKQYNLDKELIGKSIPAISRVLSGVKRFNQSEFDKYMEGLIPGKNPLTTNPSAAASKYNDFVTKDLQAAFNQITSSLPKGHQDMLRQKLGLNDLPFLNSAIKTPGANPGTPTGATPALPQSTVPNTDYYFNSAGQLVPMTPAQQSKKQ
jgi:hypothetical protein